MGDEAEHDMARYESEMGAVGATYERPESRVAELIRQSEEMQSELDAANTECDMWQDRAIRLFSALRDLVAGIESRAEGRGPVMGIYTNETALNLSYIAAELAEARSVLELEQ
jgi:hypothetical protein